MTGFEENHTGIDPSGPLAGVRVLALEQAVAGPLVLATSPTSVRMWSRSSVQAVAISLVATTPP